MMVRLRGWPLIVVGLVLVACQTTSGPTPTSTPGPVSTLIATSSPSGTPAARTPPGSATPLRVPSASPLRPTKWGVHLLLDDGVSQWPVEVWDEHLAYARWLVGSGGYVLELVRADDLDPVKWQRFVDGALNLGLMPIIRLATWQDRARGHWVAPPKDANGRTYGDLARRYAQFAAALRTPGPLYLVVGNEPNRGDEWGGRPDPAEYAQFLLDVSSALHSAGPGRLLVLNGGLDQYAPDSGGQEVNGFRSMDAASFLDGMQNANPRVWDAIDIWASHAYPLGPFSAPPGWRQFQIDDLLLGGPRSTSPPSPGLYNRGINSYRWELFKLASYGYQRSLRVFVTETGWRHVESQTPSSDSASATVRSEQVASYIQQAFDGNPLLGPGEQTWTPWSADADVGAVILFALGGEPSRWGHTNLVELAPDGRIVGLKPQFAGLAK